MVGSGFKDKLMSALHTAVQTYNDNRDANAAVVKAAEAHDFNVEQTSRLVETFNTARTIYHYKSADDRALDFDIADGAAVISTLFKDQPGEKQSADLYDYTDYDLTEADYRDGLDVKAAGVRELEQSAPAERLDTTLDAQAARAQQVIHGFRDLSKTAHEEARMCDVLASRELEKAAAWLCKGYEDTCQDRCTRLAQGYGADGEYVPVLSKLGEHIRAPYTLKAASADELVDDRDLGPAVTRIKEAYKHMQSAAEFYAIADQLDKEAADFEATFAETVAPLFPVAKPEMLGDLVTDDLQKSAVGTVQTKTKGTTPEIFGFGGNEYTKTTTRPAMSLVPESLSEGVGDGVKDLLSSLVSERIPQAMMPGRKGDNASLSERLRNQQRQLVAEELFENDPILSEEPELTRQAYEAVLNIAPDMAMKKEVLRAVLRQAVHSNSVDPFAAENWTRLEANLRRLEGKDDDNESRAV